MNSLAQSLLIVALASVFANHGRAQDRFFPDEVTVALHTEPWLDPDHEPIRIARIPGMLQKRGSHIRFLMVSCRGVVALPIWRLDGYVYPFENADTRGVFERITHDQASAKLSRSALPTVFGCD